MRIGQPLGRRPKAVDRRLQGRYSGRYRVCDGRAYHGGVAVLGEILESRSSIGNSKRGWTRFMASLPVGRVASKARSGNGLSKKGNRRGGSFGTEKGRFPRKQT